MIEPYSGAVGQAHVSSARAGGGVMVVPHARVQEGKRDPVRWVFEPGYVKH